MSFLDSVITRPEYDFLKTDPRLGKNIMFLTLGGSHAYGTNTADSDIDVRGCALQQKSDLLGLSSFEQVIDNPTDTTVYAFNKLIGLLANCKPNVIELLGCKPEHYALLHPLGRELLDHKKMFLSKRADHSYGVYAIQQLRCLQNALAQDDYPQAEKEKHIKASLESAFPDGAIRLSIGDSAQEDLEEEIYIDVLAILCYGFPYIRIWGIL